MYCEGQTLKAQIYNKVLKKILNNQFPMDELLVESRLVKMFKVSRAPVREALIELCQENILRNIPRAGYQIVRISEKEMRDAFQLRLILEREGLRIGIKRLNDAVLDELRSIAEESDRARTLGLEKETLNLKMKLNTKFHLQVNALSGNRLMNKTLYETLKLLRRGIAQIMLHENKIPVPDPTHHSRMVRALRERDLDTAIQELSADIKAQEMAVWNGYQWE